MLRGGTLTVPEPQAHCFEIHESQGSKDRERARPDSLSRMNNYQFICHFSFLSLKLAVFTLYSIIYHADFNIRITSLFFYKFLNTVDAPRKHI